MSNSPAKQRRIDSAKKAAPNVPGDTCSSIDYVQAVIEQITDRVDDDWTDKQLAVANKVLEYIRDSNEQLRSSSDYWYKKYKGAA